MPEVKKTSKVAREHLLMSVLSGFPLVILLVYGFLMEDMHQFFHPLYMLPMLIPCAIIGLWLQNRRWVRMKCPECNRLLGRDEKLDGQPLTFHCEDCDIIWDTGFTDQMDC